VLATSLLTAPILYFFFFLCVFLYSDVIITSLSCRRRTFNFYHFFLNNTETESYEKQVVVELCLFSETQPETGSISQFDSWECKSAGNFCKHRKCMCKLRNLPIHGNVNQPETSASIGNACVTLEYADPWECKSAGNFRKHRKYMYKLRNFPVNGNVNQLENSAISESSETL
jgi:hypothetical protein